jgi:hypothetical protein
VSPVKYEMGFYIPEEDILHSHSRGNLKSYILNKNFGQRILLKYLKIFFGIEESEYFCDMKAAVI